MKTDVTPSTEDMVRELRAIAAELGEDVDPEGFESIRELMQAPRLRLLVAGTVGAGKATLVNGLLRQPDLLPQSPIPKEPVGVVIRHGERLSAERVGRNGSRMAIFAGQLRQTLLDLDDERDAYVELRVDSDLLETCDVRIEALEATRSAAVWRDLLGGIDYVILVLNAGALLSDTERRFVRERLVPELGLERVAIVINRIDTVPEEERDSLIELVRAFLGSYQSQPAVLAFSAQQALQGSGEDSLSGEMSILIEDLLQRRSPLRTLAVRRALEGALADLTETAARLESLYALDEEEVERARSEIASRREWLDGRVERVQRRIQSFVATLLKEQLLRRLENFGSVMRARLPDEIRSIDDLAEARRYLPGYVETVWMEFLRGQMIALRGDLALEEEQINDMIRADLQELLSLADARSGENAWEIADPQRVHVFVMPKRGKHRVTNIVRGLSLNGFFLLFVSPQFGVLSLLAGQALQRAFGGEIEKADREALISSALGANRELEREIKRRIDGQISTLVTQMEEDVASTYRQGVERVTQMLQERAAQGENMAARKAAITAVRRQRIPRLQAALAGLAERATL